MFSIRIPVLALAVGLLASSAWAAEVRLGATDYVFDAPDGFSAVDAKDEPAVLLRLRSRDGKTTIEALSGGDESSHKDLGDAWEKEVSRGFVSFDKKKQEKVALCGVEALFRRYEGSNIVATTEYWGVFLVRGGDRIMLVAKSTGDHEGLKKTLLTLRVSPEPATPAAPAPSFTPYAPTPAEGYRWHHVEEVDVWLPIPEGWKASALEGGKKGVRFDGPPADDGVPVWLEFTWLDRKLAEAKDAKTAAEHEKEWIDRLPRRYGTGYCFEKTIGRAKLHCMRGGTEYGGDRGKGRKRWHLILAEVETLLYRFHFHGGWMDWWNEHMEPYIRFFYENVRIGFAMSVTPPTGVAPRLLEDVSCWSEQAVDVVGCYVSEGRDGDFLVIGNDEKPDKFVECIGAAGICDLGKADLAATGPAPRDTVFGPRAKLLVGHVYYVRSRDGKHVVKITPKSMIAYEVDLYLAGVGWAK